MVVEVFRTNVIDPDAAVSLVNQIHRNFVHLKANFDLNDCDNILRVASNYEIDPSLLIRLLDANGFYAEVLPG